MRLGPRFGSMGQPAALARLGVVRHAASVPSGPVILNAEASAVIARMTTAPTNTRAGLIDTLVGALKSGATSGSNIWAKLDGLVVVAAADIQAAALNWIAGAATISAGTFTADQGWQYGTAGDVIDTGFNPTTATSPKYVLNSAHFAVWTVGAPSASSQIFPGGTNTNLLESTAAGAGLQWRVNQGLASSAATPNTATAGHFLASRQDSATNPAFANGVKKAGTRGSGSLPNFNFATQTPNTKIGALHWGSGLSDTEAADIYNALHAYMQAVAGVA